LGSEKFRSPSLLLGSQLLLVASSLAANVIIARAIGPEGRGAVAFMLQTSYVIVAIAIMGRDRAYPAAGRVASLSQALADQVRLIILPTVIILALSVATVLVLGERLSITARSALLLTALCLGGLLSRLSRGGAIAARSAGRHVYAVIASQVLLLALLVLLWNTSFENPDAWTLAYAAAGLAPFVLIFGVALRGKSSAERVGRTRRLSWGIYPSTLVEMLVMRLDRVLLPVLASYSALGLYAAVATMAEVSSWPARQFADSRVPAWSTRAPRVRQLLREIAALVLLAALSAIVAGLVIAWTLVPLMGQEFEPAKALIIPLCLAAFASASYRITMNVGIALRVRRFTAAQAAIGLVAALVLYPWWIAVWGALGAAWASVAALFLATLGGSLLIVIQRGSDLPRGEVANQKGEHQ
jgi:O-antigen/teichoic acid export membrane protein